MYGNSVWGQTDLKGLPYLVFLSHLCNGPGSYGAAGDRHPREPEQDEIFPCVEGKKTSTQAILLTVLAQLENGVCV